VIATSIETALIQLAIAVPVIIVVSSGSVALRVVTERRPERSLYGPGVFDRALGAVLAWFGLIDDSSGHWTDDLVRIGTTAAQRARLLQEARSALESTRSALETLTSTSNALDALIDELEYDLDERARRRAELDEAIARNEELAAVSQRQVDALADELMDKLAPRDRRSLRATFWMTAAITAVFGTIFFFLGRIS
jgi:hypothetical protein